MQSIAHISDLHFGTVDPQIADTLVGELNERAPALIVVSGDLTQRARVSQYRAAAKFLARLTAPKLIVPGNHDVPLFNLVRRWFFPFARYRRWITEDFFPTFSSDEMFIAGLNTARRFVPRLLGFWKDGAISRDQLDEISAKLATAKPGQLKILVTHHPFMPPSRQFSGDVVHGAAAALKVLESAGVELLLAGHLHRAYHGDTRLFHIAMKRSIISVQAGTATSQRTRGEPNAYNWIEVHPYHFTLEVRAWNGFRFERREDSLRFERI